MWWRCVQVNSLLQTSNPDVYAVGDIAAFPLTMYGGKVSRQEHVVNARSVTSLSHWLPRCMQHAFDADFIHYK